MTTIKELYDLAYNTGNKIQEIEQSGKTIDGREIWRLMESKVKDINLSQILYNSCMNKIYDNMNEIILKYNMNCNELDPKYNHFFMQLKNLVKTKSNFIIEINRIMQLGYNAGQLNVFLENIDKKDYKNKEALIEIKKFVEENELKELDTYVSVTKQKNINIKIKDINIETLKSEIKDEIKKTISSQIGGNNYKHKYIKYKQKYLQLKKYN